MTGELVCGAPKPGVLRDSGHEGPVAGDRSPELPEHGLVKVDVLEDVEDPDRTERGRERDIQSIHLDKRYATKTSTCDLEALHVELRAH